MQVILGQYSWQLFITYGVVMEKLYNKPLKLASFAGGTNFRGLALRASIAHSICPLAGRYMTMKLGILTALFLLAGCNTANNMIGLGKSFEEALGKECLIEVVKNYQGVTKFSLDANQAKFIIRRYEADLTFYITDAEVSGYEITLDGMFLGETSKTFYRNAHDIQKELHQSMVTACQV